MILLHIRRYYDTCYDVTIGPGSDPLASLDRQVLQALPVGSAYEEQDTQRRLAHWGTGPSYCSGRSQTCPAAACAL